MSGSDWRKFSKIIGLASAAFLVLALLYAVGYYVGVRSGYYEGQAERTAGQYRSDTQRIVDNCFKLPARADVIQCVDEAAAASHENQRAEYDLNAQRDMADWAWWVMVVGALQFFATIATLGFVKLTLDATLEAVKDTGEATGEMRKANILTSELARPWVSIHCEVDNCKIFDNSIFLDGRLIFENLGQSPAQGIQYAFETYINNDTFVDKLMDFFTMARTASASGRDSIMPGERLVIYFRKDIQFSEFDVIDDDGVRGVQVLVGAVVIYKSDRLHRSWPALRTSKCFFVMRRNPTGGWDRGFSEYFNEAGADDLRTEPFRVGEVS